MINHFGHPHPLVGFEVGDQDQETIICSCCEENLISGEAAYSCCKSNCGFNLHKSCSEFPRNIQHKSHIEHQLVLHSKPPYEFSSYCACDACGEKFNAFIYHCSECHVNIHPKCTFSPETAKREDHDHTLRLYYSSPYPKHDYDSIFVCKVCQGIALNSAWVYYCSECDYGTHFRCVNSPVEESSKNEQEDDQGGGADDHDQEEEDDLEAVIQAKLENQRVMLQFQMAMNDLNAKTLAILSRPFF